MEYTSVYIQMDFDICYNQILLLKSRANHQDQIVLDPVYLLLQASKTYKEQLRHALRQVHDNALKNDSATAD